MLVACGGFAFVVRHENLDQDAQRSEYLLKLGHGLDQNHPVHKAMVFMAQRLSELSSGSAELQIFPNGQLGSETACLEQLQLGALAMTKTSAAPMESFIPEMAVFGVPYIFRDDEHFWRVLEGSVGQQLLAAGKRVGLRGLCYYDAGTRSFYTIEKPILSPADLKGLKIRVQKSKTSMDMVHALGGSPTPIPWGELYTALQQRMVDGAENNPPSFMSNRHYEVCKHLSLDEHTRIPDILLVSEEVWSKLPTHVQQWVQQAADESSKHERKLWREKTEEALKTVQDEGVSIHYPDKTRFTEKVTAMHREYEGTPVGRLLKQIHESE